MKNIVEEAVSRFNDHDIDKLAECWHEDINIYELLTNKVLAKGKSELKEFNREETKNIKFHITIENQIKIENMIIIHKSHKDSDYQDVSICEIEDNLIKNVWVF